MQWFGSLLLELIYMQLYRSGAGETCVICNYTDWLLCYISIHLIYISIYIHGVRFFFMLEIPRDAVGCVA